MVTGPNKTVANLMKELVLIEVFRDCYLILEKNFVLNHLTIHHTDSDMMATFQALAGVMERMSLHIHVRRRKTGFEIAIDKGLGAFMGSTQQREFWTRK